MDSTNPSLRHFRKLLYGDTEPNELNEANETIKIEIISDINLNDDSSITNWLASSSNAVSDQCKPNNELSKLTNYRIL